MTNEQTAPRAAGLAIAFGLSLAMSVVAIDVQTARGDDQPNKAQAAEPKLIGRFSIKDASDTADEPASMRTVAVSDDGKRLAIMGYYGSVSLWDISQGKIERQLEKPVAVSAISSIPHEIAPVFLTGSDSLAVLKAFVPNERAARLQLQMWNMESGKPLYKSDVPAKQAVDRPRPVVIPQGSVNLLGWNHPRISSSGDGTRLAVGINTGRMELDLAGARIAAMQAGGFPVPDAMLAMFPRSPTIISVLDVAKKRILTSITTEWGFAPFVLSDDGKRLAVWDGGKTQIAIYDVERPKKTMTPVAVCAAERCALFELAFSADSQKLLATYRLNETKSDPNGVVQKSSADLSKEMYVGAWEIASGKSLHEAKLFVLSEKRIVCDYTALSADGRVAAGPAEDKTLRIIQTSDGTERAKLDVPNKEGSYSVVLSRNGRYVASSTDAGEVLVWDLEGTK